MSDLISRQAAIDAKQEFRNPNVVRDTEARTAYDRTYANGWNDCNSAWINAIKALPSARPERLTDYSFEESCTECPAYDTENHRCPRFNQVIRTALKDANLEPCEDCISRQAAIDTLDVGAEVLRRVLDEADVVGVERAKYEWGLGLIESYIADVNDLPPAQPEPCEDAVSRKMAMDAITASTPYCVVPDDYHISVVDMEFRISTLPSVTPKRKTGKWIRNDNNTWSCDQCRSWIPDEQHYYARYCLYCGAKMEEDV